MHTFHAVLTSVALLALLLAVLRHRQQSTPLPLLIGVVVGCLASVFPLTTAVIGIERINDLLEGRLFEDSSFSSFSMSGADVSEDFMLVQMASNVLTQVGGLLTGIGLLMLVQRLIRERTQTLQPR